MSTTRFRSAAALTIAGLTAAALPLLTAGTAEAATISKSFSYGCKATPAGFPISVDTTVGVTPKFTIPSLYKGQAVGPTKVALAIKLDENLRSFTYNTLGGRQAEGGSTDAVLNLSAGGVTTAVPISKLSAPKTAVPEKANTPWIIPATGTAPKITVPNVSSVDLSMPASFTINSTVYKADGTTQKVDFSCALPTGADALITTQKVRNKTTLKVSTSPSKIVAKRTKATVSITAKSASTPTGKVSVYNGKTRVGSGKLSKGKAKIKISAFRKKGKYTLTIKYAGDKSAVDTSVTKAVRVS